MSRPGAAALVSASLAVLLMAGPVRAQEIPAPPAGGIVPRERPYALGFGFGGFSWSDEAPYDNFVMATLAIERRVLRIARGRAQIGYGETTLLVGEPADTRILALDLQVILLPEVGPLRDLGILPYGLGGFGSLITNPVGGRGLLTRSQSQVSWGGGLAARLGPRWEARGEVARARVRLADPVEPQDEGTSSVHTLRWEGRIQWLF